MIKVGIIGCGSISDIYLQNLTHMFRNVEVYAVADLIEDRAIEAANKYNVPHVMTTDDLLSSPDIGIVVNLTTPQEHFHLCKQALLNGKHIYVEKPLSLSTEQGDELVALAAEKQLLLGSAPDTFLGAGIQTCRKLIDDGYIGKPVAATAFMVCHGHESWHPDPEFYYQHGGGPMLDMGPYYLTALVTLLGPAATVCGMTGAAFKERKITSDKKFGQIIPVEVATHVTGNIEFQSGAIASIITSFDVWSSTLPRIEIYGETGTLIVPDPNTFGGPIMYRPAGAEDFKEFPLVYSYGENSRGIGVADMANCIEHGGKPRANGELANHVLEMMHAFQTSSDTKQYVTLKTNCEQPKPVAMGLTQGEFRN
ncbi:Gfo/Idh/MocA family oxidoreductase [Paenibacillus turicensis]|uniref:Gfo/Idh/MocA family protein n=1 Tax=Paenibacillus turicensis TaxID=160487 RepID=UPI003D292AE2